MSNKFSNKRAALQSPPVCISPKPSTFCLGALLCDKFNDFDGTLLTNHVMDNGPGWQLALDPMRIMDDHAVGLGDWTAPPKFTAYSESTQAQVEVQGWFYLESAHLSPLNQSAGLILNAKDNQNWWVAQWNWLPTTNIRVEIYKVVSLNYQFQGSVNVPQAQIDTWQFLRFTRMSPTQIQAKTIGAVTLTVNGATDYNTETKHGITSDNQFHPIDNFRVFLQP